VIDAVTQAELGFHPAARTQLSGWEKSGCSFQFGAVPRGLVVNLRANAPESGISQCPVQATLKASAAPAQVPGGQLFHHHHLMLGSQFSGRGVNLVGSNVGHSGMGTADLSPGAPPPLRRVLPGLRYRIIWAVSSCGAPLQCPQLGLRGGQWSGCGDTVDLNTVRRGDNQQVFNTDVDANHRMRRPTGVRRSLLVGDDYLE
jgi:hypothetical protein